MPEDRDSWIPFAAYLLAIIIGCSGRPGGAGGAAGAGGVGGAGGAAPPACSGYGPTCYVCGKDSVPSNCVDGEWVCLVGAPAPAHCPPTGAGGLDGGGVGGATGGAGGGGIGGATGGAGGADAGFLIEGGADASIDATTDAPSD